MAMRVLHTYVYAYSKYICNTITPICMSMCAAGYVCGIHLTRGKSEYGLHT